MSLGGYVYGALAFSSGEALEAALEAALQPLVPALGLGVCSPSIRDVFGRFRRGARTLVIERAEPFGFTGLDEIAPRLWRLAEASLRGELVIASLGECPYLEVACRDPAQWQADAVGPPTARWLGSPASRQGSDPDDEEVVEFEWITHPGSGAALDLRDWAGFLGELVEHDGRILFRLEDAPADELYEWADPSRPGVGGVVALPGRIVWTEVQPARELQLPSAQHARAIEVVVHRLETARSEFDLVQDRQSGCCPVVSARSSSLWFVEARGLVAARSQPEAAPRGARTVLRLE